MSRTRVSNILVHAASVRLGLNRSCSLHAAQNLPWVEIDFCLHNYLLYRLLGCYSAHPLRDEFIHGIGASNRQCKQRKLLLIQQIWLYKHDRATFVHWIHVCELFVLLHGFAAMGFRDEVS